MVKAVDKAAVITDVRVLQQVRRPVAGPGDRDADEVEVSMA